MTYKELIKLYGFTNRAYRLVFYLSEKIKNLEDYLEKKEGDIDFSEEEFKEKYISKKPIERITNEVYFCEEKYCLMDGVFCPRDETEMLVEEAGKLEGFSGNYIDLCSGSGVIGISVLKRNPGLQGTLLDISEKAVENIRVNLEFHSIKAKVIHGDWLEYLKANPDYQLITANFPYVAKGEIGEEVHDPDLALYAEKRGWKHYGDLIDLLKENKYWKVVILECSEFHEEFWNKVTNLNIKFVKDIRGKLRVAVITR